MVAHHQDTTSGENGPDERPGWLDALSLLVDGEAHAVAVSHLDRLARNVTVLETLLATVWSRDGRVFDAGHGEVPRDDPNGPARTLIRQVMGAVAQYERAMIVKRMGDGRRHAIARGRIIGPAPAFGWRKDPDDPGRPVPDPDTYPLVEEAVRLRDAGATLREVGTFLEGRTDRTWTPSRWRACSSVTAVTSPGDWAQPRACVRYA